MKYLCAHTAVVELHKLQPNPKNPNHHPDKQIEMLAKIIDYQGQRSPIVVSKRSGFITKGHGRLMALQKLGWESAACDYQDYDSEAQEYADLIADNKIAELAEHDDFKMIAELKELKELSSEDLDFQLFGLENFLLEDNLDGMESAEQFGDYSERYSGENTTIKLIYEKELWASKKQKIEGLIKANELEDVAQLFLWLIDGHS